MNRLPVTNRGKSWELINSIFVVPTFFLGFGNWIAFLYCGWLVKRKKWLYYSPLYASPLILTIIIGKFTNFTFCGIIISGIVSIVHAFKIREEFLIRYDRILKNKYLEGVDIEELINENKISSQNTPITNEPFHVENENTQLKQESDNIISTEDISENINSNIKKKETENKGRIIDF